MPRSHTASTVSLEDLTHAGLPRSFLRPCILLLLAEGPSHGYDLLTQLSGLGLHYDDRGTVYRCLRAMEQERFLHSWWEHSTAGPARRTYALTSDGVAWLQAWVDTLQEAHDLLHVYLGRYAAVDIDEVIALAEGPT